jgi:hypothetical protein
MRFLKLCALLAIVFAETGCGLPDEYYLQPPVQGTPGTNYFVFSNPSHSADFAVTFTGFELFYKFYSVGDTININAYDPNNPSPPDVQLLNAGFLPITAGTDVPVNRLDPVIPVDTINAGFSFTIQVSINPTPGGNPVSSYSPSESASVTSTEIRRYVTDPTPSYGWKNFLSNFYIYQSTTNYLPTDKDFNSTLLSTASNNGGFVVMAMYALSYGLSGISTPTRSTPVYLGSLNVQVLNP